MRKLLTGTAIVFLVLFTAAFVSAKKGTADAPAGPYTGTLFLVEAGATATTPITELTNSQITLAQVSNWPLNNFYVGTLVYTLPGASPTTVDMSIIQGPVDTAYHIVGANLLAVAQFGWFPDANNLNAHGVPKVKWGLGIVGVLTGTTTGNFQGALFNY